MLWLGSGGPAPAGGCVREAGDAERCVGRVPEGGCDVRRCPGAEAAGVFFHGDVADVVQGLGLPVEPDGGG